MSKLIIDGIRRIIGERSSPKYDPKKCEVCNGSGGINHITSISPFVSDWVKCRACSGTGRWV